MNFSIIDIDHLVGMDLAKTSRIVERNSVAVAGLRFAIQHEGLPSRQRDHPTRCESPGSNTMPFQILKNSDVMTKPFLDLSHRYEQSLVVRQRPVGKVKPKDAHPFLDHPFERFRMGARWTNSRNDTSSHCLITEERFSFPGDFKKLRLRGKFWEV